MCIENMTNRLKKIGFILLKLLITLLILLYLVYKADFSAIKQLLLKIDVLLFCLSFIIIISRDIFLAMRWKILLAFHNNHFSSLLLTQYYYISAFFSLFLPTAVGGDVVRWYYLHDNGIKHNHALSSILYERFLGIISLVFFASFCIFVDFEMAGSGVIKITMVMFLFLCLASFVTFWHFHRLLKWKWLAKILSRFKSIVKFIENIRDYSQNMRVVLYCLILSLIAQLMGILAVYLIALSLGSSVNFLYFIVFLPIVWLISMIPISIGGLGLREGAFILLFMSIGMPKEMAIAISALVLLQIIAHGMLGGVIFLFFQKGSLKEIKNEISN
jgi:uncharacterized protein (TIRG00374 family)